jgi:fucose permease
VIHSTPEHFGEENSQAIIGVQMASAYVGVCLMPPVFGLIANHISVSTLPLYVGGITALMIIMCERLNRLEKP